MSTNLTIGKATRQAFGEALAEAGARHPEVVVLDADLAKSTKSEMFAKKFPERFFEMGISEANMIGAAAGLSFLGKTPFACSFGCFLTGRYDQIRLSVAYAQAPVRLIGTHAGVGIGDDGHSQMGLEDISLMRALPLFGVFQPMDAEETTHLIHWLSDRKNWPKPAYVRLTRQNVAALYPKGRAFDPFTIYPVFEGGLGRSITIFASGGLVGESVLAARTLAGQGFSASVWNVCSLKPFDSATVLKLAQSRAGAGALMVSAEDHSVIGGLGSALDDVLSTLPAHPPLLKIGVQDQFGESGEPKELYEKFGLSHERIVEQIRKRLG